MCRKAGCCLLYTSCISFHREKSVANGGPDGGDGGRGGNVVFEIDKGKNTLLDYRYHRKFAAENGENGKASKCHGKNGTDLVLRVPEGTLIKDPDSGAVIKDMSRCEPYVLSLIHILIRARRH